MALYYNPPLATTISVILAQTTEAFTETGLLESNDIFNLQSFAFYLKFRVNVQMD